jgi:hypothetical protein
VERLFFKENTVAKLAAIVVFPEPPFCWAMVITLDIILSIKNKELEESLIYKMLWVCLYNY